MLKASDNTYDDKIHRIIAIVDDSDYGYASLAHAFKFARIFRADLAVIQPDGYQLSVSILLKIEQLNAAFLDEEKTLILTPSFSGSLKKNVYRYAEEINAIIMVLPASRIKNQTLFTHKSALKLIQKSRIPCVVTGLSLPSEDAYKNVVLPIDSLRQSKEKSLWAGYFSRFYKATVHVLIASYSDGYFQDKVNRNLKFTQKIYANLEIEYKIHDVGEIKEDIDEFALSFAPQVGGTLILVMTTRFFTVFDLFFGPSELNVIANSQEIPVMCINQRDDLYVLCT
ncbi:MAG: hypothetical protein WCP69_01330 [Bacteroidota bacterium]